MSYKSKAKNIKYGMIAKYKLGNTVMTLRRRGYTHQQITDRIINTHTFEEGDTLNRFMVKRYLDKFPEFNDSYMKKEKFVAEYLQNIDIVSEITELFNKSKILLNKIESEADEKSKLINSRDFKSVMDVLIALIDRKIMIQKEISEYNNIRKFLRIIADVVGEISPESIPPIMDRLRDARGVQWFADIMEGNDE